MSEDGYEVDPDKMREAISLVQDMLDELDERSGEVPDLVRVVSPAGDEVSNNYTVGQQVGSKTPASVATSAYSEAFNGQYTFLGQLLTNLQTALQNYEAMESSVAETADAQAREVD